MFFENTKILNIKKPKIKFVKTKIQLESISNKSTYFKYANCSKIRKISYFQHSIKKANKYEFGVSELCDD